MKEVWLRTISEILSKAASAFTEPESRSDSYRVTKHAGEKIGT